MLHLKTCFNLVMSDLSLRMEKARDSWRLARCLARVHRFDDGDACTRCDARRVEHWGHWVVVDG